MSHEKLSSEQGGYRTQNVEDLYFGTYEQRIYDSVDEAGHIPLASAGEFGWGMPSDVATERFVQAAKDKVILEVGTGLGHTTVVPALERGANAVFALDITPEHVNDNSYMQQAARAMGLSDALHGVVIEPSWWDRPLQKLPTITSLLGPVTGELPEDGGVDMIMARHSLQFGDHHTVLRYFDLASAALKEGGIATAINFTQFTEYMFAYDNGHSMHEISALNRQYAEGKLLVPGGYMHAKQGLLRTSLAQLMGKNELDRGHDNRFIYLDDETITGLLALWSESRRARSLPADLIFEDGHYFAPSSIATVNKLVSDPSQSDKENFVFTLKKTSRV